MALPGQFDALGNPLYMLWPLVGGTKYREYTSDSDPSPKMSFAPDNSRVTRQLLIGGDAVTWKAAKQNFLGYSYVTVAIKEDGVIRVIRRNSPHSFPHEQWLYATSAPEFEQGGFKQTTQDVAEYIQSKMTVVYSALTYNVLEDASVVNDVDGNHFKNYPDEGWALAKGWEFSRNVTKTVKPSAKLYSLARGSMQVVGADLTSGVPKPLLEGLPFVEPAAEVQYTWHAVPHGNSLVGLGVPWARHLTAQGCINNATFDRYPAGTLRLEGIEPLPKRDAIGNRVWDVVYKMQFLPRVGHLKGQTSANDTTYGHNYVYTADGNSGNLIVARVTSDGLLGALSTPPYRSLDFRLLFNPDQT